MEVENELFLRRSEFLNDRGKKNVFPQRGVVKVPGVRSSAQGDGGGLTHLGEEDGAAEGGRVLGVIEGGEDGHREVRRAWLMPAWVRAWDCASRTRVTPPARR